MVVQDGAWGSYMKNNSLLKSKVQAIVFPYAKQVENDKSISVDICTSMEIENGEDMIGYQYLHGTNADAGGFTIVGSISKNSKGDVIYDLTYTWNDIIDPNLSYDSDSLKAKFAEGIPFSTRMDYTVRISWTDRSTIRANPSWFFNWDSGWLA